MEKAEIVIYRSSDTADFQIEVRVEDETVWLSQAQMAQLFNATKQNISLHISNIFNEGELDASSTVKEYLTVQSEGSRLVQRKFSSIILMSLFQWVIGLNQKGEHNSGFGQTT